MITMKTTFCLFVLFLTVYAYTEEEDQAWIDFKRQHKKVFSSATGEDKRKDIFLAHKKEVEEHNERFQQGLETYEKALYSTADLSEEEFNLRFAGLK